MNNDRVKREFAIGVTADTTKLTVGEYLDRWLENTARPRILPKTYLRYKQLVRLHLKPNIGVVLSQLRPFQIDFCYRDMMGRKGAGARVCQMAGTILHTALRTRSASP